ncbi:GXN-like protein [Mya arenaria]|uniref:GXN-like protein n=1 Tax=Mya arenaria TaxID=6604 RepID=A0ABY7DM16_MYAAR|nr:GXN-like protein [Mya arenaria]
MVKNVDLVQFAVLVFDYPYIGWSASRSLLFWYLTIPTLDGVPQEGIIQRLCGLQQYNPNDQFCCSEQLHDLYNAGVKQKCCGGNLYMEHLAICCGSNIIEKKSLLQYRNPECCRGKIYSDTNASEDLNIPNSCCGDPDAGEPYNSKKYYCCGSMLTPRTPRIILGCCCGRAFEQRRATYKQECNNCTIQKYWQSKCGGNSYNPATHVCCVNEVVYVKNSGIICCKDKLRKVVSGSVECCQATGELYDTNIQSCCAGQVIQLSSFGCCNNEIYNKADQNCCYGLKTFNKDKQVCCKHSYPPSVRAKNEQNPKNGTQTTCPFCSERKRNNTKMELCIKRREYSIILTDLGMSHTNMTRLKGVVLSPKRHRGERVDVQSTYKCQCFEKEALYLINTNKRMKPMRHQQLTLRLTSRDKMVPETKQSPCLIYKNAGKREDFVIDF